MTNNTITITLDDIIGPNGIEGVWDAMVAGLVSSAESKFIHSDGYGRSFHKAAVEAINAAVQRKVEEKIEDLLVAPIQITDNYGNAKGTPTTFTEMIGSAVERAMTEKTDATGRPSNHGMTIMERAIQNVAKAGLAKMVKEEARKFNAEAKAAVSKEIARAVAATIK